MMTRAIINAMQAELSAALPRWGMSAQATLAFLSHSENTTFLAHDPLSGRRIVLRVQRLGYHTAAEIVSELSWIDALIADTVVVTPRPVPDRDGLLLCPLLLNGSMRQVVAFEHMSGHEPDQSASLSICTPRSCRRCLNALRPDSLPSTILFALQPTSSARMIS